MRASHNPIGAVAAFPKASSRDERCFAAQAAADGWLGITKGMPVHVNAAQVEPFLREGFFVWRFFAAALMLAEAFVLWLLYRSWEAVYLEQNLWKPVPLWVRLGQKVLAAGSGAAKGLQALLA